MIVDDTIKNAEEAVSETYRQRNWDWWQTTACTRLEPGGAAIVVHTRWHPDDLIGRILRESNLRSASPDSDIAAFVFLRAGAIQRP